MGNCLASGGDSPSTHSRSPGGHSGSSAAPRKSQPLKTERPVWRSDPPLTADQLRRKREEFWDTAPAFEGRKEIWDALKAAITALETDEDQGLAQAIIDGASISLPTGTLSECYDELGTCYQLPAYVLGPPSNLVVAASATAAAPTAAAVSSGVTPAASDETLLKLRLSSGKDLKLPVSASDTVAAAKQILFRAAGVPPAGQRWFFGGRALDDKSLVKELKIPQGYVVQVLLV